MDNGPRRHPTYSFFVTKEQAELLIESVKQALLVIPTSEPMLDVKRRLINLRDAIKRREPKEKS